MWNGNFVMISLAGLGEATGGGEVSGVGESSGVGAVLGVALAALEGLDSGDAVCWPVIWVQAAKTRTTPAINAAGATPFLTIP
jgi:hypothetical protein